ncbi:hypothetical protein ACWEWD_15030 [Streptomyces tendae]
MNQRTRATLVWPAAAVIGALALSACSGDDGDGAAAAAPSGGGSSASSAAPGGDLAVPAGADEETKKKYLYENEMAACMRAQGFVYTPKVTDEGQDDPLDGGEGRDYAATKKWRQKYGFGTWAGAVYRDDPSVFGSEAYNAASGGPRDEAYLDNLSNAERQAYFKAYGKIQGPDGKPMEGGCLKKASDKIYGPGKSRTPSDQEIAEERQRALANQQALNGDSQLVALAQKYANCLTGEGINVTTTQPTSIADMVKFQVADQTPADGILSVSKSEATTKLTNEIHLAEKDLECGKEFRAAYFPKLAKHPFESVTG